MGTMRASIQILTELYEGMLDAYRDIHTALPKELVLIEQGDMVGLLKLLEAKSRVVQGIAVYEEKARESQRKIAQAFGLEEFTVSGLKAKAGDDQEYVEAMQSVLKALAEKLEQIEAVEREHQQKLQDYTAKMRMEITPDMRSKAKKAYERGI